MVNTAESVSQVDDGAAVPSISVQSQRFGSFDVPHESVLNFPDGLIGFPQGHRYVILDHRPGSPFKWLLSIDNPELAFAVAHPGELVAGYEPPIEVATRTLGVQADDVALFVIVTIPPDPRRMTVNLMAPVVVDARTRTAYQIVLEDARFSPAHRIVPAA
jgi:flagellar assembly factor FliW